MPQERTLQWLVGLLALSIFLSPWHRELYVGDETKYSQVVREMREGSFFLPTLHGTPFTHKPPVHFWMIDLLTYPLGLYSIWPFVLPSLMAYLALLILLKRWEGWLAAFVAGSSLMIWGSAQTARMDVSFTVLLVAAAWFLLRAFEQQESGRALLLCGVCTGAATLVKGPMAPVILVTLYLFEWWRRKRAPRRGLLLGAAAMVILPLLWFVPAMILGGEEYTREIVVKQTAGRAFGSWVHQAAPWFYLVHAPADLAPWFLLCTIALAAAIRKGDERSRFFVSWILAVLVPYSLLSSKLDIYMMAMIPPAALLIARFVRQPSEAGLVRWGWRANMLTLFLLLIIGAAGLIIAPSQVEGPEAALIGRTEVRALFGILVISSLLALIIGWRGKSLRLSTLGLGLVPLSALVYAVVALIPLANELASTRPLARAVMSQNVPPESVALYFTPHLWIRDMPPALERVQWIDAQRPAAPAAVIITSRRRAGDIEPMLQGRRKTGAFRMSGKWFDVYRR